MTHETIDNDATGVVLLCNSIFPHVFTKRIACNFTLDTISVKNKIQEILSAMYPMKLSNFVWEFY